MVQELPIESLKMIVRAHISQELPSAFRDIIFQVYLEGPVPEAQLEGLAREASRHCFVENTLEKAIPITTEVHVNGRKALTLNRGPQAGNRGPQAGSRGPQAE